MIKTRAWHFRHRAVIRGFGVERCSCGAIRMDRLSGWMEGKRGRVILWVSADGFML